MLAPSTLKPATSLLALQATFLSEILPRIETHAQVCFRGVHCPHKREEFRAEMVAVAWLWFLHLIEKGKDPLERFTNPCDIPNA